MGLKKALSALKIGAIGFGGGAALIPICEKEFVDDKKYVTSDQYNEDIIVSNITPGALPVKLCASMGRRDSATTSVLAGYGYGFVGTLLSVIIFALLAVIGDVAVTQIAYASVGISVFIIYLLLAYIKKVQRNNNAVGFGKMSIIITICSLGLTFGKEIVSVIEDVIGISLGYNPIFNIATVELLLLAFFIIFFTGGKNRPWRTIVTSIISAIFLFSISRFCKVEIISKIVIGIMVGLSIIFVIYDSKKEIAEKRARGEINEESEEKLKRKKKIKQLLNAALRFLIVYGIVLALTILFFISHISEAMSFISSSIFSSVTTFGGGIAYLSVAEGFFVDSGFITSNVFFSQIVPIANALPGTTVIKVLSLTSYAIGLKLAGPLGGIVMAIHGYCCVTSLSCAIFMCIYVLFKAFANLAVFDVIKQWILPVISGLLISTLLSMLHEMFVITHILPSILSILVYVIMYLIIIFMKKKNLKDIFSILIMAGLSVTFLNILYA